MTNGFFQLVHKDSGTYIRLVPPKDGGEVLSLDEVREYLDNRTILYDSGELRNAFLELDQEKVVKISDETTFPRRESYSLWISSDKMTAVARFYAPSLGAKEMSAEEMLAELKSRDIKYGVCEENIRGFFKNRAYCQDIVVAQGKPYKPGVSARIEYMFPTQRKAKPALREDGSVDFHKLNTICPCREGELLARLIPATYGEKGCNIYGAEQVPPPVKEERLRFGKNISVSEDYLTIYSKINGHVTFINGEVFVSNLLELENVDASTGDIDHNGSILVRGNVYSGYSVKATGDIEIKGVVEGARVTSDGNISIARGMNGMSKGVLSARGNIVSRFLENAEVSAEGYVSAEAILHSQVRAGTEVEVTGRKGFIIGGKVMATHKVAVKSLGSPMGGNTTVEVGVNPELKKLQSKLLYEMQEARKYIASVEPVIMAIVQKKQKNISVTDQQMKNVRQLAISRQIKKKELENIYRRLDELEDILEESKVPSVEISESVYAGTKICILDVSLVVKSNARYCKFIRSEGEVKMTAL